LHTNGNPIVADATGLATLFTSVSRDARPALPVSGGIVDVTITIPAHSLQLMEVQAALAPVLTLGPGWNLVGNSINAPITVATCINDASQRYLDFSAMSVTPTGALSPTTGFWVNVL
jgi:hypothetical protein